MMFQPIGAFSGFSVDDLARARRFYTETLGLDVEEAGVGIRVILPTTVGVFVYPKPNHRPAEYTVLNFEVDDVDQAVAALKERGVTFEQYPDETGTPREIFRGTEKNMGPDIAWFKDPAGNFMSVLTRS